MSTPRQRLEAILANAVPSKIVFKGKIGHTGTLRIWSEVISEFQFLASDDELQRYLRSFINQSWDRDKDCFAVTMTVESLFYRIQGIVINNYENISKRSATTKLKTSRFIRNVDIDKQANIASFLIQMFIDISSPSWDSKSQTDRQIYFETLESLRRVYGKQQ